MRKAKIKVYGKNLQNFINALYSRNIKVYQLQNFTDYLQCAIDFCRLNDIQSLYANSSYKIEVIHHPRFKNLQDFLTRTIGVFLALTLFVFSIYIYNSKIWNYQIYGLNNVERCEIEEVLNENGGFIGAYKSNVNLDNLALQIIKSVDGVALASANIVGTTLIVTINEKIDNSALLGEFESIKSTCVGVVSKIVTTSGTALVKVGDKVAQNQILIDNYVLDSSGARILCKAKGEIYLEAYYSFTKVYHTINFRWEPSGRTQRIMQFDIDGDTKQCKFTKYQMKEREFYLSKILPIKVIDREYYELVQTQYTLNLEKDIDKLVSETKTLARKRYDFIDNNDKLQTKICDTADGGKQITVTFVKAEQIVVK